MVVQDYMHSTKYVLASTMSSTPSFRFPHVFWPPRGRGAGVQSKVARNIVEEMYPGTSAP